MPELLKEQKVIISEAEIKRIYGMVSARMGLHFPESRRQEFMRAINAFVQDKHVDPDSFCQSMLSGQMTNQQIEVLAAYLTVGETYFFREMDSLNAFQKHVIPELISRRDGRDQRLRIWSAGCSTGEEAYTIAMLIDSLIPNYQHWDVNIHATDINSRALHKARSGIYTNWSFRATAEKMRNLYFEPGKNGTFAVRPRYRENVTFAFLNLATDTYPSLLNNTNAMDVVFCRNVMMYFVPEVLDRVLRQIHSSLVDGGWLIVAPSENYSILYSDFKPVHFEGATLYRKEKARTSIVNSFSLKSDLENNELKMDSMRDVYHTRKTELPVMAESFLKPGPEMHSGQSREPYAEALLAYSERRYADAEASLKKLFSENDSSVGSRMNIGYAYSLMARIYANRGDLDQSREWCKKAISVETVNPAFRYLMATISLERGEEKAAVQELERVIYLDSGFALAHYALGNIAMNGGRIKDAKRHFRNAEAILTRMKKDEILPESDGIAAGRLLELICLTTFKEAGNEKFRIGRE